MNETVQYTLAMSGINYTWFTIIGHFTRILCEFAKSNTHKILRLSTNIIVSNTSRT